MSSSVVPPPVLPLQLPALLPLPVGEEEPVPVHERLELTPYDAGEGGPDKGVAVSVSGGFGQAGCEQVHVAYIEREGGRDINRGLQLKQ